MDRRNLEISVHDGGYSVSMSLSDVISNYLLCGQVPKCASDVAVQTFSIACAWQTFLSGLPCRIIHVYKEMTSWLVGKNLIRCMYKNITTKHKILKFWHFLCALSPAFTLAKPYISASLRMIYCRPICRTASTVWRCKP